MKLTKLLTDDQHVKSGVAIRIVRGERVAEFRESFNVKYLMSDPQVDNDSSFFQIQIPNDFTGALPVVTGTSTSSKFIKVRIAS